MSIRDLDSRAAEAGDADAVFAAITEWWPGIHMVRAVCPRLFAHFGDMCIIVEDVG